MTELNRQNIIGKVFNLITYLAIVVGIFMVMTVVYWQLYPYKIIEWKEGVFPVKNKVIKKGENLTFISNYCKHIDVSGTLARKFVDGIEYNMPETSSKRETGCHTVEVVVTIPKELPVGEYTLRTLYKYDINPIRTIAIEHDTERFMVVE